MPQRRLGEKDDLPPMDEGKVIPEFDGHRIIWHERTKPEGIYGEKEEQKQASNFQRSSVSGGVTRERVEGVSYYEVGYLIG
jgi:hypothetical protein